ncbi:MAG TPA: PAS domain S-box protein [Gemmataceae bacterium]|jgi:PAS domain S-box-containing protein|nr:PAS domain S-box protein [Gemmataceae bacterium]
MNANIEELAQTLFEEAGDALFLFDPDNGQIMDANPMAQRLCGATRPGLLRMSVDYLIRSDQQGGLAALRRAYRNTAVFHSKDGYYVRHAKGNWIPVNLSAARLHVRPKTLGLITARDITERKRADEMLKASEERYRLIFERNMAGVIQSTLDGTILDINDAFAHILGFRSRAEALGRRTTEFFLNPSERESLLAQLRTTGSVTNYEVCFRRLDGRPTWALANVVLLDDPTHGKVVQSVIIDLTERKAAETAIRAAEYRLQYVLASSPSILFTLAFTAENARSINWISDNLQQLLGYSAAEATSSSWWTDNIHPDDRDRIISQTQEQLSANGHAVHEYRFRHKDGQYRWIRDEFRLVHDATGKPLEAVGSWSDITARKQLEDQFQQAQKMEAIGSLAAGVAHDFNNLLTVILGFSDFLHQRLRPDDDSRGFVSEIQKAANRASSLTRQLLAFSRRQILQPRVLDLNSIVTDMDKMLRRVIGEDISLATRLEPNLHPVHADPGQIEQVLLNLAVNARDAMPTGGRLKIATNNIGLDESFVRQHVDLRPGAYVMIAMTDTGCGMTPEVKARIFEPFFTTKEVGKGTGLGLATVYGIIKQSGGHIDVSSEPGHGTTFNIYLPRFTDSSRDSAEIQHSTGALPGTETILLAEDEDGVRILARTALADHGYTVLEAKNGQLALELARSHAGPIHLIVTDVVMPLMDGRQLAEQVIANRPETKVLYISGYTDDAIIRHGVSKADAAFLHKPFTPRSLARKVRKVLDGADGLRP